MPGPGPAELAAAGPLAAAAGWGNPPRRPLLTGLAGSALMAIGGVGAAGVLVRDPLLSDSPLGFWRYGHGRELAVALVYGGLLLLAYAWMRLGRAVLAGRAGGRGVVACAAVWTLPMLVAPPMYTRDAYYYLAQGALPLAGLDPYAVGPEALPGPLLDNVAPAWVTTPTPYGPLFVLVAGAVAAVTGQNLVAGVIVMRVVLLLGLALLVGVLPGLTRRMGGNVPVALWIVAANPVMVVHVIGGVHNDLLVVGLIATAALLALQGRHGWGVAAASAAMAIKATAGFLLPFLVLVWAAKLSGPWVARVAKAGAAGLAVFAAVFGALSLAAGVGLGWLPALKAPATVIHWYSLPTGAGQLVHAVVNVVADADVQPFIEVTRVLGALALLALAGHQWWVARDGGPEAVRRAGIVLLAAAVLGPTLQSWYPSWGMVLLAATAWTARGLALVTFGSLFLMVVTYPDGVTAQHNLALLGVAAALWALAAVSLHRPDPLRLRERWSPDPRPTGAQPRSQ